MAEKEKKKRNTVTSSKLFRTFRILLIMSACCFVLGIIIVFGVNAYVKASVKDKILTVKEAADLEDIDCILVLGCLVREDGVPSDMLHDRLQRGVEIYELGGAPKLLMTGDHGRVNYNEVGTMKQFAIEEGIASSDVFMDHAGFSTYESMYRADEIFGVDKVIIVTQEYHLYRALYVAESFGMEAYGVAADYRDYGGQTARDIREILARCKDFLTSIWKPEPTYLGEFIPIDGNGDITNDGAEK